MPVGFSQRLLSVLQLTRMALVFTAIADSTAALMLADPFAMSFGVHRLITVVAISVGLYGYGMSLNDIIDRRRDRQIAAHRPLPSGRIGLIAAHVICVFFGLLALAAGVLLARHVAMLSLVLLVWTGGLITFYDFAGKYMVAPGLLTLGLIRFFHATIPAPQLPVLWHPLLLLNHVAILSTVAYAWEQKRPALTRIHWWSVIGGLCVFNAMCIGVVWGRGHKLMITPSLIWPAGAVGLFLIVAVLIRFRSADIRSAGRNVMLAGLLWLIIYDASFVIAYGSWTNGIALLMLLPIAYLAVLLMRWWAKILLLSQKPEYQRAR
jgi:4-hydroxybenzoate polyprenyltransferase